jgi:hypothetical protein
MKLSAKLVTAMTAAIWMIPISEALAGIDFTAGDWKVDFSGNFNGFYVGSMCDHNANTMVAGGLACTGDDSASVRNGLLPAALVFSAGSLRVKGAFARALVAMPSSPGEVQNAFSAGAHWRDGSSPPPSDR